MLLNEMLLRVAYIIFGDTVICFSWKDVPIDLNTFTELQNKSSLVFFIAFFFLVNPFKSPLGGLG